MFLAQVLLEVRVLGEAALASVLGAHKGLLLGVLVAEVVLEVVASFERLLRSRATNPAAMIAALLQLAVHLFLFLHMSLVDVAAQRTQRVEHQVAFFPVAGVVPRGGVCGFGF